MGNPEMLEFLQAAIPEIADITGDSGWPTEAARQIFEELLPEWQVLFLRKNKGYGEMAEDLGPAAQFVDIHRKVGKLKRALWDKQGIGPEDVEEVTLDLIGHCFLLLRAIRPRYQEVEQSDGTS